MCDFYAPRVEFGRKWDQLSLPSFPFSFFPHWVLGRPVLFFVAALPDSAVFPLNHIAKVC